MSAIPPSAHRNLERVFVKTTRTLDPIRLIGNGSAIMIQGDEKFVTTRPGEDPRPATPPAVLKYIGYTDHTGNLRIVG